MMCNVSLVDVIGRRNNLEQQEEESQARQESDKRALSLGQICNLNNVSNKTSLIFMKVVREETHSDRQGFVTVTTYCFVPLLTLVYGESLHKRKNIKNSTYIAYVVNKIGSRIN